VLAALLTVSRLPVRATARGNRAREAQEQFVCQRPTQASAPSAMPSGGIACSYFESRRRQPTCKHRTSTFSQNENMPFEQGGNTLWLRSLPYPFKTFFRSWKKRQSVLRITVTMVTNRP
jgi:hypothetical protein